MYQPVGSAVFVVLPAVFESVSKFSVAAVPIVVRETLPVPVSARTDFKNIRFRYDPIGRANAKLTTRKTIIQFRKCRKPCLRKRDITYCYLSSVFAAFRDQLHQGVSSNESAFVKTSSSE